jgi:transcriptional regulator with XRE-family HTH domain
MGENKNRLSNHLILLRKRSRLSQKSVARRIGLKDGTLLSRYERGVTLPPLITAIKLSLFYQAQVPELFPNLIERLRGEVMMTNLVHAAPRPVYLRTIAEAA